MSDHTDTALDTALTDVARIGVELRKMLSELEDSCDTAASQSAWIIRSIAATSRFVSAISVFHILAQGEAIPTLDAEDAPVTSDDRNVAETVIMTKRPANMSGLEKTLVECYELDGATAKDKASDLSTRFSRCLEKTMKAVNTKLKLQDPINSTANEMRLQWASTLKRVTAKDQSWMKNFATEGSLAFPTELADPDGLLAPTRQLRAKLTILQLLAASISSQSN